MSSDFNFDDEALKAALKRIYNEDFNPMTQIEENLFGEFWNKLNEAAGKGLGKITPVDTDVEFYRELQYNNGVFAAFKVHRMQNDMAAKLLDENGELKPFKQWLNDVQTIADHQVVQWFGTEYDTAVKRAHLAAEWKQFEREADVLPNLEWIKSTSITPGEDHRIFWGTVRPIHDAFWELHKPGDRWGCKCGLRSTDKKPTPVNNLPSGKADEPAAGLGNNPAADGKLFSSLHPYFTDHYGSKKNILLESDKLMTKYSREEVRKHFQKELKGKSLMLQASKGPAKTISVSHQDIKTITGKPHKYNYMKNTCCYWLPQILKKAEYLGWSPDMKGAAVPGHGDVKNWHYYRFRLNNEDSFLVIKERMNGEFRIHAIQDKEHFKENKLKNPFEH
ncbi:hypothetical protein EZS27_032606 [termite gut metagenome]|uniref:Large polyvalent protein-associated domain-containing protein n=1 Tax=termite gut metagenome TaxID=433724 RepID=A0A5J4Q9G8_9ZZZZ